MHYITNIEELGNLIKKVKPTDRLTVFTPGDSLSLDTVNILMGIKATVEFKEVSDEVSKAALIGYLVGKEGKNVALLSGEMPEVLKEYVSGRVAGTIQRKRKPKDTTSQSDKNTSDCEAVVVKTTPPKTTEKYHTIKKETDSFEKNMNPPEDPEEKKEESKLLEEKPQKRPTDKPKKSKSNKEIDKTISEIAEKIGVKADECKKRLVSCFKFEDSPEDGKEAVEKTFSEYDIDVWKTIQPIVEDLFNEANKE